MNREKVVTDYYFWLLGMIGKEDILGKNKAERRNIFIYKKLFNREFVGWFKNDSNRAEDGYRLREEYLDETGIDVDPYLESDCSMLEMLIALAYRCENDIMFDSKYTNRIRKPEKRVGFWFDIMVGNLFDGVSEDEIDAGIDIFVNRNYQKDGHGGLFPLKWPENIVGSNIKLDQRKTEIWFQLSAYLQENYKL